MMKNDDIKAILSSVSADWEEVSEHDIAFAVLCDTFEDKNLAYTLAYGGKCRDVELFYGNKKMERLMAVLRPFGVGRLSLADAMTSEENKQGLIDMLSKISEGVANGEISKRDALKIEADIRVKLQDKFDVETNEQQHRIIIVPQKKDMVCPHTHKECTQWPSKEDCIKHYKIKVEQ